MKTFRVIEDKAHPDRYEMRWTQQEGESFRGFLKPFYGYATETPEDAVKFLREFADYIERSTIHETL